MYSSNFMYGLDSFGQDVSRTLQGAECEMSQLWSVLSARLDGLKLRETSAAAADTTTTSESSDEINDRKRKAAELGITINVPSEKLAKKSCDGSGENGAVHQ